MDKLRAIKVFLSVAETGSFTQTAERLEISKPMITRYVALMEEWLGARLLQRTTRKVSLTDAGEQAVFFCRKMADLTLEMEREMTAHQGELRGMVRVASNSAFGANALTLAVNRFLTQHPKLNIQLHLSETLVDLVEERIDLALRFTHQPDPNLVARKLADCHSLLVATPAYLAQNGTPQHPTELAQHCYFAHANLNRKQWQFSREGETLQLDLISRFTSNDTFSLLNATLAGNGIAMLPKFMVLDKIQNGTLQPVLTDWQLPKLTLYALYPTRHQLPLAVRKLLDFLVEEFAGKDW